MYLITALIAGGSAWALWMLISGFRTNVMEPMARGLGGAVREHNPVLFWLYACFNTAFVAVGVFLLVNYRDWQ